MKSNRLFEIIYILLNKPGTTAKELAETFEVSTRTIYRDIEALSASGVPIYANRGKGGGIRLLDNFVLNKAFLSEKDQNEILSALKSLSAANYPDSEEVLKRMSKFFNKNAVDWLEIDHTDWSNEDKDKFAKLKRAIIDKLVVKFTYYSSSGKISSRSVEPLKLFFKHNAWYVWGYCTDKKDYRLFKLLRIKDLFVTDTLFERSYEMKIPLTTENSPDPVEISMWVDSSQGYRVYDFFEPDSIQKNEDGSFNVTFSYVEDEWTYGFILSFGHYAKILSPEHIVLEISSRLRKSCARYII